MERRSAAVTEPATDPALHPRRLAAVGVTTLLAMVGGVELHRLFDLGAVAPPLVLAALGGAAGPLLARWRHVPAVAGLATSILLGLVAVSMTVDGIGAVVGFVPGPAVLDAVADAVINGWAQILSTGIPAPPRPSMVLLAPLLAWAAAWLAAEIVLRTDALLAGVLPPLAALVTASVLVVPVAGSRIPAALAMVVGAGLLVALGSRADADRGVPSLRPARAAATGVVVLALGTLVAPHLPWIGDARTEDPRPDEPVPDRHATPVQPLSLLAGWAADPDGSVATVRADRQADLRLMVLDRYDGTSWTSSATLQVAGSELPPASPGDRPTGDGLDQDITIHDLPGDLLPAVNRPVAYKGPPAWWDADNGILLSQDPAVEGEEVRYEVRSALVPPVDPASVGDARPAAGDPAHTEVPDAPPDLASLVLEATTSGTTPSARALLLERFVRERARFDPDAPSGSAWVNLEHFLLSEEEAGGRRGTSEQFATAFAAMARIQGLPSRVVVGATPPPGTGATWHVRGGDMRAWPEVHYEGVGWVAYDPTPEPTDDPVVTTTTTEPPTTAPPPNGPDPEHAPSGDEGDRPDRPGAPDPAPSITDRLRDAAVPGLVTLVVLAALVPAAVAAAKALRRRRRRSVADPGARVLGAWADAVDDLRSRGVDRRLSTARAELAALATEALGPVVGTEVAVLASLANAAGFGAAEVDDATADQAWELADRIRAADRGARSWWARLLAAGDPRSLRSAA